VGEMKEDDCAVLKNSLEYLSTCSPHFLVKISLPGILLSTAVHVAVYCTYLASPRSAVPGVYPALGYFKDDLQRRRIIEQTLDLSKMFNRTKLV